MQDAIIQNTEAQPKNTLSLEVANELNYGRIVSAHMPKDNKTISQDSAIEYKADLVIRNPETNAVIDVVSMSGVQTKGADSMTSKTTYGLTITALIHEVEGANNPQLNKMLMVAIEAATSNFKTVEERVAFWAAHGVKWTTHKNTILNTLRTETKRVKTGSVKIHPNA